MNIVVGTGRNRKAPKYPAPVDSVTSARCEVAFRERQKKIAGRKGKK